MKSSITRILSIILALSLIICCFSACGGNEDDEQPTYDIEMPTNPDKGSDDVYVNDGSNSLDVNLDGNNSGSNNSSSNNQSSNSNSYVPNYNGNSSSNNSSSNNSSSNNSSSNNSSSSSIADQLQYEVEHFMTHIDTPEERNEMLALAGYEYDPVQDVYYTSLNPWQRSMGFTDLYDTAAPLTNMWYLTLKADFIYDDLLWRLQWWKGQYGVLEGAELGVYTKKPENEDFAFYKCADDDNLLEMQFDYYHSVDDYNKGNPLFTRYEQQHWWITGFKFGVCNPTSVVVKATIYVKPEETGMADGIEKGLQNLTDKKGNPTGEGFTEYKPWTPVEGYDYFVRDKLADGTHVFYVIWKDAGYTNY